jgi:membrane-bound acyltransferase YfiQ involved in biofilm formation
MISRMSFALYMFGLAVLLAGIAWGLVTAGIAVTYVVIACLVIAGLGIMMAVSRTRAKDPPA